MQKSIIAAAVGATALALTAITPVQAGVVGPMSTTAQTEMAAQDIHKVGRRGRRGLAIGAGIVTLGILAAIASKDRAYARVHRYERRRRHNYHRRCRRLLRWCRQGDDRACWRFDRRC